MGKLVQNISFRFINLDFAAQSFKLSTIKRIVIMLKDSILIFIKHLGKVDYFPILEGSSHVIIYSKPFSQVIGG